MTRQLLIYDRMVPISAENHGDVWIQATGRYDVAARLNAIPLLGPEFIEAGLDHPVVFLRDGGGLFPVALMGLRPDRNEHVADDGRWDDSYLPAFLRRYPFALAKGTSPQPDVLTLCLDESYAGVNRAGRGDRLFDSEGNQTAFLRRAIDLAAEFHSQHHRTAAFCQRLDALGLFDPAEAEFTYWSGRAGSLGGFSVINRGRLRALPEAEAMQLFAAGGLEMVHAHLASLHRIDKLRDAATREGGAALARATHGTPVLPLSDAGRALKQALDAVLTRPALVARSRKIAAGHPPADRLLFTFARADLCQPDHPDALAALVGYPLPPDLAAHWEQANVIHLGLDSDDPQSGPVRKLYLEFPPDASPEPGLVYLALKVGRAQVIHRYDRQVDPTPLVEALCPDPALRGAVMRLATQAPMILKVHEQGGARLSLDINLANLTPTQDLQQALDDIVAQIDPDAAKARHWPSHLAIGQDSAGLAFATLYGWPGSPSP